MKKFLAALLLGCLFMLAVPVSGAFAASVASPQQSQKHVQQALTRGSGHSSATGSGARVAKISITRTFAANSSALMVLGPWNANISFSGGVPVGGWANLTLYSDGSYNFSGHFHDSGFFGYNTSIVWAVKNSAGTVFTFSHSGSVSGTFGFGSRDDNWDNFGSNPALAAGWNALMNGWAYQWEAGANFALGSLLSDVTKALGFASAVIAIV